ncbi:cytochrome c-type biogenesis protein [Sneathiella sp.]|uniref:cytochrome c-type biogenesis protein n=1 Tax=Sneathiella sp. TaxID=1964365 RepID=UPI0025D60392|nr:cytochrome c-type biogenesis protein [Sneathiella sp.]
MKALCHLTLLLCVTLPFFALPAGAVFLDERLEDPAQEARARDISGDIRCLVCQNQSILDSNADLAQDLRQIVRERITLGDSDAEVRDYLVRRYGDWVLLDPPFKMTTYLLWIGPAVIFLIGALLMILFLRGRSGQNETATTTVLTREEQAELDRLFDSDGPGDRS